MSANKAAAVAATATPPQRPKTAGATPTSCNPAGAGPVPAGGLDSGIVCNAARSAEFRCHKEQPSQPKAEAGRLHKRGQVEGGG